MAGPGVVPTGNVDSIVEVIVVDSVVVVGELVVEVVVAIPKEVSKYQQRNWIKFIFKIFHVQLTWASDWICSNTLRSLWIKHSSWWAHTGVQFTGDTCVIVLVTNADWEKTIFGTLERILKIKFVQINWTEKMEDAYILCNTLGSKESRCRTSAHLKGSAKNVQRSQKLINHQI